MNLIELFAELSTSGRPPEDSFASRPVPGFPAFRIAMSANGLPAILLQIAGSQDIRTRNLRLRHLSIEHQLNCSVSGPIGLQREQLTVIRFLSRETGLQEFFLRTAERLMEGIGADTSATALLATLDRFAELFRAMSDTPTKTVQGLWSELLLLEQAHDCGQMVDYWHSRPEEKFDFNAGANKLEVKSFSGLERAHYFAAAQLDPPETDHVVIASIQLRPSILGLNIFQLSARIEQRLSGNPEMIEKIHRIISHTLGTALEQAAEVRYDYLAAIASTRYFYYRQIPRILLGGLDAGICEVKFRADLSACPELSSAALLEMGTLFNAMVK